MKKKWIRQFLVKRNNKKRFYRDLALYKMKNKKNSQFVLEKRFMRPCFDWSSEAGTLDEHYFLQDLYMATQVLRSHPEKHYDIGSRIDGFIAHLLTAMEVTLIDIRPLAFEVTGLHFLQGNATSLEKLSDASVESLSSLHALEHFGLGRYGDPIDPDAWIKALNEMQRVVKPGGKLYLSVPIGDEEKLCFNAHRIFSPKTIVDCCSQMELEEFVYIRDMKLYKVDIDNSCNKYGSYSCGLFIFRKE